MRAILPSGRQMLWGLLVAVPVCAGLLVLAYFRTTIPQPNAYATAQTTVILAADHKTVIARIGAVTPTGATVNRKDVPLSAVPAKLQDAVLAAEDRHFYSEPAVSVTGTMRALIVDVLGRDISQGGSTITQQYVKNAYLTQQRTFTRKLSEILIAMKLGQQLPKTEILDDYLNTIYFGRGAYGVATAAHAYFGKPLSKLTTAQDILLAGVINDPTDDDPRNDLTASQARFDYIVSGMVSQGWLSQSAAERLKLPHTRPLRTRGLCAGNNCFIADAVNAELSSLGFTPAQLAQGGYRVVTTIQPQVQKAAQAAIHAAGTSGEIDERTGKPEASLVSIKPGDGAIEAMYAGPGCQRTKSKTGCIDTTGVRHLYDPTYLNYGRPPGSSMKPYTLIAALEHGLTLGTVEPGPPEIEVDGTEIHNAGGESCSAPCTLVTALAESINTVFVPLAETVGPRNVAAVAHAAGIQKDVKLADNSPEITLGTDDVPVVDQADGYATIAAGGMQAAPYLVSEVIGPQGQTLEKTKPKLHRAFSSDIAADATYAMEKVLACSPEGTACGKVLDGGTRPAAGKTGTATNAEDDNSDAWFIGFTPQLATAVWEGEDKQGETLSIGGSEVYGGEVPASIWQSMMNAALEGQPIEQFPQPTEVVAPPTSTSPGSPTSTSPTSSAPTPPSPPATTPVTPPTGPTGPTPPTPPSTPIPPPAGSSAPSSQPSGTSPLRIGRSP